LSGFDISRCLLRDSSKASCEKQLSMRHQQCVSTYRDDRLY
jgi:hypothetical protein